MADIETTTQADVTTEPTETEQTVDNKPDNSADISKLRAELARMKAAMDKAAKEAGDAKKALRAKQTAEEAAAEAEKEQREAMEKELAELRKERNVAQTSKKVMAIIQDEKAATDIATHLYGAEDVEAALDIISKAWIAREKALRMEYGKVPAPGTGAASGVSVTKEQYNAMTLMEKSKFATEHPDEYNRMMGRTP